LHLHAKNIFFLHACEYHQ